MPIGPFHFVASKIEAFLGRGGGGDFVTSYGIENLITSIEGRPELADELSGAPAGVQGFVRHHIGWFLLEDGFRTAILGYLPTDAVRQARFNTIVGRATKLGPPGT